MSVVDDVDDVRALLKHFGHRECAVGGWSGGGKCLSHEVVGSG
jgi:hypothetical protein